MRGYENHDLAMDYYKKALIVAAHHGKCTTHVVAALHSLAEVWLQMGNEHAARVLESIASGKSTQHSEQHWIECFFYISDSRKKSAVSTND